MSTAGGGEEGGDLEKLCLKTSGRAAGNLNSGTFARIEKISYDDRSFNIFFEKKFLKNAFLTSLQYFL